MIRTFATCTASISNDYERHVIAISVQSLGLDYEIVLTWNDFSRMMTRKEPWSLFVSIACDALGAFDGLSDLFNELQKWHGRYPQPNDVYAILNSLDIKEAK